MESGTAFSWAVLGLLNLAVAWLIFRSRPTGPANWIAAALIGTNALFAAKQVAVLAGWMEGGDEFGQAVDIFLAPPPFVAFIVFPFFFPRRRLSPPWERAVLGAAAGLILLNWGLLLGGFWATGHLVLDNAPHTVPFGITMFLPFFLGLAAGTLVLLDTYVTSPSRIQRDQARFVLAAYLLKVSSFLAIAAPGLLHALHEPTWASTVILVTMAVAILGVPWLAVVIALGRARLRKAIPGAEPREGREDLFVLGAVAMALPFFLDPAQGGTLLELEYMLARPLLFAYAILKFQLLDVDIRRFRVTVGAIALAAIAAVFIATARQLRALAVDVDAASGIALAATLATAWLLVQPILARAAHPGQPGDDRSRLLYRAALEAALAAKPEHRDAQAVLLQDLRGRLGISEREHQSIEANARAILGTPVGALEPGQLFLGQYRIVRPLGQGGFGATFLAHDETIERDVVIKATRASDPEAARRALREARTVARLRDPHIVTLYNVDEVAGQVYLVMEHMEQGSLADRLERGPLGVAASGRLFLQVLGGLEAAHGAGLVHGDVKPANILLGRGDVAKLADFGVARAALTGPGTPATASGLSMPAGAGSLHYMAPEQVRGLPPDARSDLYAWAASWHEAITGRHYLGRRDSGDFDLRVAIVTRKVPAAREIPAALAAVLSACLAKDPADRPQSAQDVRQRLQALHPADPMRR